MADDSVQVINHHQANLAIKPRTAAMPVASQRTFVTTTVESEPITVMLDEGAVARRAAEMLAQRIREQTEAIVEQVTPATAKARRKAEKAFANGESWAMKRFSGGRTGVTPPRPGENRMFNHSGRLARGIFATFRKEQKDFAINYPVNRWQPKDWPSMAAMQVAFQKWVDRIPVLNGRASEDVGIRAAIKETFGDILQKQKINTDHKTATQKGRAFVELLNRAGGGLRGGGFEQEQQRDDEEAV